MTFIEKLKSAIATNNTLLCVGLDSEVTKLPARFKTVPTPQYDFNRAIIDATVEHVCAFKPNTAFYEQSGEAGIKQLKQTCDYIRETHPQIPIILDAKRADIGNTNNGYVDFAFQYLGVDAITIHPYLGREAVQPFLDQTDKGCIVLARTSNPGAGEFQDLVIDNKPLYLKVATSVATDWNTNNNCMLVTGATYPEELKTIRQAVGDTLFFLVPGIGAQGGDLEKTLEAGLNSEKSGLIINSSRGIIFASNGDDFAEVAADEAHKLKEAINKQR